MSHSFLTTRTYLFQHKSLIDPFLIRLRQRYGGQSRNSVAGTRVGAANKA